MAAVERGWVMERRTPARRDKRWNVTRALGVLAVFVATAVSVARGDVPTTRPVPTTQPAHLFDPARHMRVSEVRPGMTGYGLSVFSGTKIERFDVEVISILKNFNPQYDVVLIR